MRIAVLSDIHGNLSALNAVLRDLADRQVDRIVNLGDSLSGPLLPMETAVFLMARPWVHLAGNHERQLLDFSPEKRGPSDRYAHAQLSAEVFAWMASLPPVHWINEEVFLCHGTPHRDDEYLLETVEIPRLRAATPDEITQRLGTQSAALVLCGHTHTPRAVRTDSGQLLVNPGSVGLQAYEDNTPGHRHVVENHSPDARYAIVEKRDGRWEAQLLTVPYDHAQAAEMARQRGRPDWAVALLHGRMTPKLTA